MFLLKNGLIAKENGLEKKDILIKGETIEKISSSIENSEAKVIDCSGKFIIPGGIDVHTHFDIDVGIKSADDFYSGGIAAIYGGTTTIIDHPGFGPKGCSLNHQINLYKTLAKNCPIDYSFHGVIQHISDNLEEEIIELKNNGISSYKLYMTYTYALSDMEILKVFSLAKKHNLTIAVHAENNDIIQYLRDEMIKNQDLDTIFHAKSRPAYTEVEAVERLLFLAKTTEFKKLYFVHISSGETLKILDNARKNSIDFFIESCPQYLFLSEKKYLEKDGVNYILSPPLRSKKDNKIVKDYINSNLIDVIGTDHCSFSIEDKNKGVHDFTKCPNGIPGVQERIPLMFSEFLKGNITLQSFLNTCCLNPAKIFGLSKKGTLDIGNNADIVILSPEEFKFTSPKSKANYSCYKDIHSLVSVDTVFIRGNIVLKDKNLFNPEFKGIFLPRK